MSRTAMKILYKNFLCVLVRFIGLIWKIMNRVYMYMCRSCFHAIGNNVIFHPLSSTFSFKSISIGDNVGIAERAFFNATVSHIYIGSNVAIAPNVTIRGGNHRYDLVGKWITDYEESDKRSSDDEPVYIEDDCWIGTNVTILKGVTIGRGSIVAAGSMVNRSCPPYSIIGGVPAKILKFRWDTVNEIMAHESELYDEEKRLKEDEIRRNFSIFLKKINNK
jgi:chloramphenicol O-acetyltransferase type B